MDASTTDPENQLMRNGRGKEARPCYGTHALERRFDRV